MQGRSFIRDVNRAIRRDPAAVPQQVVARLETGASFRGADLISGLAHHSAGGLDPPAEARLFDIDAKGIDLILAL